MLGSGDPTTAKMAVMLEAPGNQEVIWRVDDPAEIERRRMRYPDMPEEFLRRGQPVVGPSGGVLFGWGLAPVQLTRNDLFIDNVLRCLPPKEKNGEHYPTKDVRKSAEAHCRQYDRWDEYKPTVSLVNIHPAAIAREPTPLPLMIQTFVKAKHFALAGERPLVLCGGKAAHMWMGHASTVQTWLGHYEQETLGTVGARERRREAGMAIKVGEKKVKVKKLTVKTVLEQIVKAAIPFQYGGDLASGEFCVGQEVTVRWTEEEYKAILSLLVPKTKKEKN